MLRLHIHSNQMGKYWLDFASREEAEAYKEQVKASAHWGKPAWTEVVEIQPELKDPETGEISPPITKTIEHPAEYQIVEEDISQQVEQQKINSDCLAYLNATDWYVLREVDCGVPVPPEIRKKRADARERIK